MGPPAARSGERAPLLRALRDRGRRRLAHPRPAPPVHRPHVPPMNAASPVLHSLGSPSDRQMLLEILAADYGAGAPSLTPLYETPTRAIYRVDCAGGAPWVLRYYPATRPLARLRE